MFPKNKFTKLSIIPTISTPNSIVCQLLRSACVLYPTSANPPNNTAEPKNKYTIEFSSNRTNIVDKVTPFIAAYKKYSIPTATGDSFLNKKENSKTTTTSTISNIDQ